MNRRGFLTLGAGGLAGVLHGTWNAQAAPRPQRDGQDEIPYGETRLAISNEERQGTVYVPKAYKHGTSLPLLMMLHGFGGSGGSGRYGALAEEFGIVLVAPDSRDQTWGQSQPGFDLDSRYISSTLRAVSGFLDIDRTHVGLGGISDGATYALSMGLAYGDTFNHLMIFSEGIPIPYRRQGKPKIFIAHGINDGQMPIDRTSRRFVPQFKADGYDVTYREYDGGHGAPAALIREGFGWFVGKTPTPL